jgi:hypothetical protein
MLIADRLPDAFCDLFDWACTVHDPPMMTGGRLSLKALLDSREEGGVFSLDPVGRTAPGQARLGNLRTHDEQNHDVRFQSVGGPTRQAPELLRV